MKESMELKEATDIERPIELDLLARNCDGLYNKRIKRLIDFSLAAGLLICLSPIFLLISFAVLLDSGRPVLYKADRAGYQKKVFKIYKFRTMVNGADQAGGTTALHDKRITRSGNLLRKTKLDEIPQLINIIKGEMSFIGPRPELLKYTAAYQNEEEFILRVRPGITDYSSVEFINLDEIVGSNNPDEMYERYVLRRKNQLRVMYVNNLSLKEDVTLFFKTAVKVIQKTIQILVKKGEER